MLAANGIDIRGRRAAGLGTGGHPARCKRCWPTAAPGILLVIPAKTETLQKETEHADGR
jgi:hypothetical protein